MEKSEKVFILHGMSGSVDSSFGIKLKENLIKMVVEIETILKYIKSNGNIDLILDKFVIEMREYYG